MFLCWHCCQFGMFFFCVLRRKSRCLSVPLRVMYCSWQCPSAESSQSSMTGLSLALTDSWACSFSSHKGQLLMFISLVSINHHRQCSSSVCQSPVCQTVLRRQTLKGCHEWEVSVTTLWVIRQWHSSSLSLDWGQMTIIVLYLLGTVWSTRFQWAQWHRGEKQKHTWVRAWGALWWFVNWTVTNDYDSQLVVDYCND